MKDGATSKVVVLNKAQIAVIKKSSQGASSEYSPWVTNTAAMWLKSAVRQLGKWVPTSAEYRKEQLRAAQEVAAEQHDPPRIEQVQPAEGEYIDKVTGEVITQQPADDEPVDAEYVDEDWPAVEQPGGAR